MSAILEIRDLEIIFSGRERQAHQLIRAVDKASFSIGNNSFVSVVGESGSGKTVTALAIGGLIKAHEIKGHIFYQYKDQVRIDLLGISEKKLQKIRGKEIAYIFQDPARALNPVLRIGDQIAEAYRVHFEASEFEAKKKVLDYLTAVKIKECERVYCSFPHELSGGMKQRAMIAMTLILEPRILIADEPTTALDSVTESEIMTLLTDSKKSKGFSVLFITHDLALAVKFSDHIYVMQKGRIAEQMAEEGGQFKAKEAYTKKLFNAQLAGLKPKSFIEV